MASTVPPTRGTAFTVTVPIFDTSGKLKTGAAFSATQVSKDNAAFGAATNAPAELATASGVYTLVLTAAEMTADVVSVRFVVSTASTQDVCIVIYTTARRVDDLAFPAVSGRSALVDASGNVSIAQGSADLVWTSATRTLTQGAAAVAATVQAGKITAYVGTTWSITLTGLTDFTGWTKLYFTVKADRTKADSTALIQILLTNPADGANDGLRIVNGANYGTHADGSIIVNSTTSITVTVKPAANNILAAQGVDYDVKAIISAVVNEISDGSGAKFTIINPTTLTYS